MIALVTGYAGLVGSEMTRLLCDKGWTVVGIDNDTRAYMFGEEASTKSVADDLKEKYEDKLISYSLDIRDYQTLVELFAQEGSFDFICHAAAAPAHEWSTDHALEDFAINATGTVNMLEAYRQHSPKAVFIQVSSSKVYGDTVNELPLVEKETRYELPISTENPLPDHWNGMKEEDQRLDGNLHSLFGASKACGDIMAKEYGTYFNLPISIFRPVCISGSAHKGVPLHGYLAYLVKCVATGIKYIINGYKGKQVRDNIHAKDLVKAFYTVYEHRDRITPGDAFNIGGGRQSNNSILEAIAQVEEILGKKAVVEYSDVTRRGDHKWCIFDSSKFKTKYPEWSLEYDNDKLMAELCQPYL